MATLYAHSTFIKHSKGKVVTIRPDNVINPGDKVTRKDFEHLDDDQWKHLLHTGAISNKQYPVPKDRMRTVSPRQQMVEEIAAMEEGQYEPSTDAPADETGSDEGGEGS